MGFAAVPLTVAAAGAFVLLLHFGVRLGLLRALTAGALIGNLPYILFATLNLFVGPEAPMPVHPHVRDVVWFFEPIVFGALIGAVCAAVFWLIAGPSLDESTRL